MLNRRRQRDDLYPWAAACRLARPPSVRIPCLNLNDVGLVLCDGREGSLAVVRWCFLEDEIENRNRTPPFSVGPLRRDYAPPFPCKRERFHCFRALKNGRSRLSRYFVDSLKRGEGAALSLTGVMQRAARYCRAHWT